MNLISESEISDSDTQQVQHDVENQTVDFTINPSIFLATTSNIGDAQEFENDDDVNIDGTLTYQSDNVGSPRDEEPPLSTPTFDLSDMMAKQQIQINNALNPNNSTKSDQSSSKINSKKRKLSTPSVSLLSFVQILNDICNDMTFDKNSKEMRFKRNIRAYIDEHLDSEAKCMRLDQPHSLKSDISEYSSEFRQRTSNYILNMVFEYLEKQGMQFLFPKEMLRFFLATYTHFITPKDFINTTAVIKSEKRAKNSSPLNNGAILQEYTKGFDAFISNMPRSNHNDIKALKFIVENKMSIPHSIYDIITKVKFEPPTYILDPKMEIRPDYSQIVIANAKHLFVLVTSDILLYYDGNQFVVPQVNIEREFTMNVKKSQKLKSGDYMLLEIISSTKMKVVDVLQYSVGKNTTLPSNYAERLTLIQRILPNITIASITQQQSGSNVIDNSCIHKPNDGFGPAYIYHKSNLIAAAIGVVDKTVVLAFLDDEHTLVVKSKASINGAVTCCLSVMGYKTRDYSTLTDPTIKMDGSEYKIIGDLNGVKLFDHAIAIELKDGNRLGGLSSNVVSKASEYKPVTVKKEAATLMKDIERQLENGDFLTALLKNISTAAITITDDQKNMLKQLLSVDTSVSFAGYNDMTS